jgi:hypothetical protein
LDRRLLVNADDDRVLRRRHVEPDHVGSLGDELGVAPGFAPGEVDLLLAQEAPDLLLMHVAKRFGDQRSRPTRKTLGRRLIQQRQNAPASLRPVLARRPGSYLVRQPGKPLVRKATPPAANRPRHRPHLARDRTRRAILGRQQHDPCPKDLPLFGRRRTEPSLKHRALLRAQPDLRSFAYHPDVES